MKSLPLCVKIRERERANCDCAPSVNARIYGSHLTSPADIDTSRLNAALLTIMPAMTNAEAYNILGVPNKATEAVVKSAYKRLALQTHPDKNPNDPDASKKFHRISEAYKRIVDPSSFHDEDGEGEDISEQEMAAMFSMMFSDMFSGGAGGMESMMNEIWGDGDDDDDDEMEPGGMGDMFHMMEMMMNDDGGEYDDEDDEDCDDEDENDNFRAYVQSLPDGMGFNISGGQEKNRGKDKTMEKLMASMGLSQSAGDYYMESIGEEDDDENYSDDESARFNVGQIGRGMEKGLTQDQMMMLMQEMLMPSIDKSFASSSSQAKKKSSCKNGHNYGQYNPKVSGSSGGKEAIKIFASKSSILSVKGCRVSNRHFQVKL